LLQHPIVAGLAAKRVPNIEGLAVTPAHMCEKQGLLLSAEGRHLLLLSRDHLERGPTGLLIFRIEEYPVAIEQDVDRFMDLLRRLGRKSSLRDPIAASIHAEFTAPQLHAILWLGIEGPPTMGELAQRVGATEKTITGIVDRLEREAFLERTRDTTDRRVVRVQLTKKGEATHRDLYRDVHAQFTAFLSLMDSKDRKDLFRIFEHVLEKVEKPSTDSSPSDSER
jgi:DNA-binding MarR family transcriptional regulator